MSLAYGLDEATAQRLEGAGTVIDAALLQEDLTATSESSESEADSNEA